MTRTSLLVSMAFVAGIGVGYADFFSPPEAVAERTQEYEDWVLMYPRGLAITQDADRIKEVREAMSAIECPASQGERADAYIRVRYVLPDAEWTSVLAIAKRACESYAVVEDVPSYAEEMAYLSLLIPTDSTELARVAFDFRKDRGRRFLEQEYRFVRDRFKEGDPVVPRVGTIASYLAYTYRNYGTLEEAAAMYEEAQVAKRVLDRVEDDKSDANRE